MGTSSTTSNAEIARNPHAPGTRLLVILGQAPRPVRHLEPGPVRRYLCLDVAAFVERLQ